MIKIKLIGAFLLLILSGSASADYVMKLIDKIDVYEFAPDKPTNLVASPQGPSIYLSWQAPEDTGSKIISGYNIYQSESSGDDTFLALIADTTSYTASSIASGQTYYFKVEAVTDDGVSGLSEEVSSLFTLAGKPSLTAAASGPSSITLTWSAPNAGSSAITGYKVYKNQTSSGQTFYTSVGNTTSYTVSGLSPDTNYYFRVSAITSAGDGELSDQKVESIDLTVGDYHAGGYILMSSGSDWIIMDSSTRQGQLWPAYDFCKNSSINGYDDWLLMGAYYHQTLHYNYSKFPSVPSSKWYWTQAPSETYRVCSNCGGKTFQHPQGIEYTNVSKTSTQYYRCARREPK